jgi:hypothetical protein
MVCSPVPARINLLPGLLPALRPALPARVGPFSHRLAGFFVGSPLKFSSGIGTRGLKFRGTLRNSLHFWRIGYPTPSLAVWSSEPRSIACTQEEHSDVTAGCSVQPAPTSFRPGVWEEGRQDIPAHEHFRQAVWRRKRGAGSATRRRQGALHLPWDGDNRLSDVCGHRHRQERRSPAGPQPGILSRGSQGP